MGLRYKNPPPGLASSVEHLTVLLTWNSPERRTFVKDVLTSILTDGKVYSAEIISIARERYGVSSRTVQRWLKNLVDIGVLKKSREGKIGEEGARWYYTVSPALISTLSKLSKALEKAMVRALG
jgi:predicted transcriptional regulator